jgi:hypothetical protein
MDSTQPAFALTPPAFEPFGGPHFTGEEVRTDAQAVWVGDPASVPLADESDGDHGMDPDGSELDQAIFAALVTP